MDDQSGLLLPEHLTGPRSYFTDLDPHDSGISMDSVQRNLKLQLLTKERIVVAASSLYHDVGLDLFSGSKGLTNALRSGIILPAIRAEFESPEGFFREKADYSASSKAFFVENTSQYVSWRLVDNSNWFKTEFYHALFTPNSALRLNTKLSDGVAKHLIDECERLISISPKGKRYLSREIIDQAISGCKIEVAATIRGYANLIYRISGARVVNSEGHFPQCNLTNIEKSSESEQLSESGIFWDIYVEAVLQHVTKVARISVDRLDRLSFDDVLRIRSEIFDSNFSGLYDELVAKAKHDIVKEDPEQIILRAEQLSEAAESLRKLFSERVALERSFVDYSSREKSLWQVANVIALFADPLLGGVVGTLSALQALPEITVPISNELSKNIEKRSDVLRSLINEKIGWTASQRKVFIDAYKSLLTYGI